MTASEVRATLVDEAGALDVYFEDQIEILLADGGSLNLDKVREVLAEKKIEAGAIRTR